MNKKILETIMATDVYKTGHKTLYPKGLEIVFSNFTPRSGNWAEIDTGFVVADGMRYVIKKLKEDWQEFFDLKPFEAVLLIKEYEEKIKKILGIEEFSAKHFLELYKLQYLPLEFRAVEEGTHVKYKMPVMTIHNTDKKFPWLVNYLETKISSELWPIITASTTAYQIKQTLLRYARQTGTPEEFVKYQAHDFSFRGMEGVHGAKLVGIGHLKHFEGSDTLPAILESGHGASVIATEHSIMSAGTKEKELETYRRLIEENPNGVLSIVSDTWDIYNVVDKILPQLKELILKRNERKGVLVIRPDSGDPLKQLFGDDCATDKRYKLGLFKLIEKHFGYTLNEKGYKVLPIKFMWGDGMTPKKIREVYSRLSVKKYASLNLSIGVGSYTYQFKTRDTYGFAMKATYMEINGKGINIFKDPITDSGVKKSSKGLLAIIDGKLVEETTWDIVESKENQLKIVGGWWEKKKKIEINNEI